MLAEGLTFLRAVDAAEADTFRLGVVQDFDGVVFGAVVGQVKGGTVLMEKSF